MKPLFFLFSLLCATHCQNTGPNNSITQAVNQIFNSTYYEEVTQEPLKGYGALQKCGENDRQGLDVCVPYYNCDPTTKTVIQTGATDGFNSIDIRYNNEENQCDHFLDVCCQIPQDNGSETTASTTQDRGLGVSSTEIPLYTSPSVVTQRTTRTPTTSGSSTGPQNVGTSERVPDSETEDTGGDWSTCGIRNPNGIDFKLSGNEGHEAEYGEFPWQVALLRTHYNKELHSHQCICGGSIIRPNVILTAAHCVDRFQPSEITVRAGEWDTQTTKERIPYQERLATRVIFHENYNSSGALNDIALILLDRPYTKVKSVGTVCLPNSNQIINSKHCFASGWGKSNFAKEGAYSVILKKIELPMVLPNECQRLLRRTRLGPVFRLHRSFTCAGGEEGKDTCTGDGGSPLVCPDPNNGGKYIQTGIVSWGVGCGKVGVPGVYTDVAKFRTWIDRILRNLAVS